MEFGFLTQGYVPESMRRDDPDAEHTVLMDDFEVCLAARPGSVSGTRGEARRPT